MVTDFKKNKNKKPLSKLLLMLGAIAVVCIAVLLVIADVRIYQERQKFISQVESLKNKIQGLENKNSSLKQGIANADNSQYMEKVAREELDLQKPGEKVVSFVVTQKEPSQNGSEQKNFFQAWQANLSNFWNWITGKL